MNSFIIKCALALALLTNISFADTAYDRAYADATAKAIAMYPDADKEGTPLYQALVAENLRLRKVDPKFFDDPAFPLMMAAKVAAQLGIPPAAQPAIPGLEPAPVAFAGKSDNQPTLITKKYENISPQFWVQSGVPKNDPECQALISRHGIKFAPGAAAHYDAQNERLIVSNTQENFKDIDAVIRAWYEFLLKQAAASIPAPIPSTPAPTPFFDAPGYKSSFDQDRDRAAADYVEQSKEKHELDMQKEKTKAAEAARPVIPQTMIFNDGF